MQQCASWFLECPQPACIYMCDYRFAHFDVTPAPHPRADAEHGLAADRGSGIYVHLLDCGPASSKEMPDAFSLRNWWFVRAAE